MYTSIMQQSCMDDFLQTYLSEEEAPRNAEEIKTVLHAGGFNLTEFLSNKPVAIVNLLEEERAEMKAQRIFGQTWDTKTDKLMFAKPNTLYTGQKPTERNVLSRAASLFDPVGLISLFAIKIGCILQSIIKAERNWDQRVSECYQQDLQEWMDEVGSMTPIQIPRCLIPSTNGTHVLHTFTDAWLSEIAAIVYVMTNNADGSCTSRYAISKTKVAPIKQLSIAKLDSEAATLGAEQAGFCESEMTTIISSNTFWTDSTATLGWIQSKQRQKMYLANIDQNSQKFQPGQLETHPRNDESRWQWHTKPHPIRHTKAVAATTGLSEHTSRLLEFCRGQWSPHMRYTSDTTSDAGHWC